MNIASKIFRGDRVIWIVFFILTLVSLIEVYSSIGLQAYSLVRPTSPTSLFLRHLLFVVVTYIAIILLSRLNYRVFSRFSLLAYWASLVLLLVMLVFRQRWLVLPGVGQFQPSEVAKVVLIVFLARTMTLRKDQIGELATFLRLLLVVGAVAIMVFPTNFSTAALIMLVCMLMMLIGGVNRKYWWRLMIVGLVAVVAYLTIAYLRYEKSQMQPEVAVEQVIEREATWGHRVYSWINPDTSQLTQENMARMAIARGGFFGKGVGNTVHARLMTQAHNDFIYAVIIEEMGSFVGILLLLLYSVFYFRCIRLAFRCRGRFGSLTVAGLGTAIYLQALLNMCVAVGVLPVTGQTLPFVSYGGTAYLFLGCGIGIIQSIAAEVNSYEEEHRGAAVENTDNVTEKEEL